MFVNITMLLMSHMWDGSMFILCLKPIGARIRLQVY